MSQPKVVDAEFVAPEIDDSKWVEQNADPLIWGPDDEGPLYFTPRYARLVDSSLSTKNDPKYSILVIGDLLAGREFIKRDKEGDEIDRVPGEPGQLVAVWIRGGNRRLIQFCDCQVKLEPTGEEVDTGMPSKMRQFSIKTPKDIKRKLVPLEADFRDKSAGQLTPWENSLARLPEGTKRPQNVTDDSGAPVPF